ncbi:MAG: helix-turn-helix domain-containing protein [bacterium]|nr:helix-turn-helix domain-containing protein [bacterium]
MLDTGCLEFRFKMLIQWINRNIKIGPVNRLKLLPLAILCLQICWTQAWGMSPGQNVEHYIRNQWQTANGLPSNTVVSIAQTPDGYLWIATAKGLVRFDGISFSPISFFDKTRLKARKAITPDRLLVDSDGILWIGSNGGLTSYDYKTGKFKSYTKADGLTNDIIRQIRNDIWGNLWISFGSGYVNCYREGVFTKYNQSHGLEGKKINAILEDGKGNLLFADRENGVFKYKNGAFSGYPVRHLENRQLVTMVKGGDNTLWIGTNNGLLKVNGPKTEIYNTAEGLSYEYVTAVREDSNGNLWIGTDNGLNRVKKRLDGAVVFEGLLCKLKILCLFEDREKNLWIGTYNSGIVRLKDSTFMHCIPLEAFNDEGILSMHRDREGGTWFGTFRGKLFYRRANGIIHVIEPPEISGTGIAAIARDKTGNLWLGTTGKGVFKFKNRVIQQFSTKEGLSDNLVTSITVDNDDNPWISTFDGVNKYTPHQKSLETFKASGGLKGNRVYNVFQDSQKDIWIAADKGITVLEKGRLSKKSATYYLQDEAVTFIYEDLSKTDGRIIWVATRENGLKRLRLSDRRVTAYDIDNGMSTDSIYQLFEDSRGRFWMMSDSGILLINKTQLNRYAAGSINKIFSTSYGLSDGLMSLGFNNELSQHSALATRKGELWFITKNGISIVAPGDVRFNKEPPPVAIREVAFNGISTSLHLEPEAYRFKGEINFSIGFTAPTFRSPEKVAFKYRLEGFDSEWHDLAPGKKREASYPNLAPGSYIFNVTACNAEGIWNSKGNTFSFAVAPYYYQTLIFKVFLLLLGALLVTAAYYIYKKRPFEKTPLPYGGTPLNPHFTEECIRRLDRLMKIEKLYLDADLTLQILAQKLAIKPKHKLSRILNEKLKRNFYDYINFYRIDEAKRILLSTRGAVIKNITLAHDVGFNTEAAFYNAFKKFTGKTPKQYKKAS